jgi:hypothetical protein
MACCGAKHVTGTWQDRPGGARSLPLETARFVLECLVAVLAVAGVLATSLASASVRRQRAPFLLAVGERLTRSWKRVLDTPFLVDGRVRCRVSGALYARSEAVAGAVYRHFYVLVLGAVTAAAGALAWACASIVG